MDETSDMPESIYFFYGGDSQKFVDALESVGLSPINREFAAFLLSNLGRQTMTQNKLSIHVESADVFYDNHNTAENFYSFLLSQQNDEAAYVPKTVSYRNNFEQYITTFLQSFSIDDQEKFDLLAFKNSKYLFYRFNDFIKVYGNPRYKLLHTRKMLDSVGIKKVEEKNKQFLIEKIIHGVEFENFYQSNLEKKPEIMETIESNYKVARRVYQYLYYDLAELFSKYVQSMSSFELQDIDEDIKINGWGIQKVSEVKDSMKLLNIFQDFYTATGRLPTFNGLLVGPDGEAPPGENKINMKQLYDLFKNTGSHVLVSLPFLGLLLHYFKDSDLRFIKNATTELYKNLSYMPSSGARDFEFNAVSDLIAHLPFLINKDTLENKKMRDLENEPFTKNINETRIFEPKIQNPLDDAIEILDEPEPQHKKTSFPYSAYEFVQLPDEIEETQKRIDDDFINLQSKFNKVNDVATEQKKQKEIEDVIKTIIKDPLPNKDFWWEEEVFNKNDSPPTVDARKIIVHDIKEKNDGALKNIDIQAISDNILKNLQPVDNRNIQEIIDDDFIPIGDTTQQQLEDD